MSELDKLEADAKDATPGPWEYNGASFGSTSLWSGGDWLGETMLEDDAQHIANMDPATTLALIERLRAAEAKIEAVRELHKYAGLEPSILSPYCECCDHYWPCPTIESLGEES